MPDILMFWPVLHIGVCVGYVLWVGCQSDCEVEE